MTAAVANNSRDDDEDSLAEPPVEAEREHLHGGLDEAESVPIQAPGVPLDKLKITPVRPPLQCRTPHRSPPRDGNAQLTR